MLTQMVGAKSQFQEAMSNMFCLSYVALLVTYGIPYEMANLIFVVYLHKMGSLFWERNYKENIYEYMNSRYVSQDLNSG